MRLLFLLLLLGCTACSSSSPAVKPAPRAAPPTLLAEMRALAGAAACTDSVQCRTVPLGARACGGPEGYLAYSSAATAAAPMQALADRYAEQRRAAHASSGMLSTCQFMPDPGAVCRAGACQLRGAGPDPS